MSRETRQSGPHWRRVMAALANRDARTAYAQIVLGTRHTEVSSGLRPGQRRDRAIAALLDAGLIERTAGNELEASESIFRDLLTNRRSASP